MAGAVGLRRLDQIRRFVVRRLIVVGVGGDCSTESKDRS